MESEQIMADIEDAPAWTARKLLRAARVATLATTTGGQPFTALVTPATSPNGDILLFLSSLSEHTRHLHADPRCAVMVVGTSMDPNPQTAPRLTITGLAEPIADAGLKARWLARHPYAALYADFADFGLWRIAPKAGLLVAGFARATRLRQADLLGGGAAIAAAEASIIAHCNQDHAAAMGLIARAAGGVGEVWQMVAADGDGCDLSDGQRALRIAWSAPAGDASAVRNELARRVGQARAD
jgi:putative heme iron utilization protein